MGFKKAHWLVYKFDLMFHLATDKTNCLVYIHLRGWESAGYLNIQLIVMIPTDKTVLAWTSDTVWFVYIYKPTHSLLVFSPKKFDWKIVLNKNHKLEINSFVKNSRVVTRRCHLFLRMFFSDTKLEIVNSALVLFNLWANV